MEIKKKQNGNQNKLKNKKQNKKVNNNNSNSNNKGNTNKKSKQNSNKKAVKENKPKIVDNNEDVEISEDDIQFFKEHGGFSGFLANLDANSLLNEDKQAKEQPKGSMAKDYENDSEDDDDEEEEEEWETKAKQKNINNFKEVNRLPIKTAQGQLVRPKDELEKVEVDEEELKDNPLLSEKQKIKMEKKKKMIEMRAMEKKAKKTVTFDDDEDEKYIQEHNKKQNKNVDEDDSSKQENKKQKKHLIEVKEELGLIASSIIEDPDTNINRLKKLREIAKDDSISVKKLSLLTQLAIYKDIIPGYRIRQKSTSEKNTKLSKEVRKLRQYETALLTNYQQYLQSLDNIIEGYFKYKKLNINESEKKKEESKSLLLVAIKCLTELLTNVPHFNFRINLLTAVIARINIKDPVEVSNQCCKCIATLFTKDESGEYSLEAMKLLSKLVKSKKFNVREQVLQTFLYLRLKDELKLPEKDDEGNKIKKRKKNLPHLTRKARKVYKENKEVEKELKEYEATVDLEKRQKMQTETLNIMFTIYFRILKTNQNKRLLPTVLEGLGRFAHLINIDFFSDLIAVLKDIMISQYKNYMDNKGNVSSACTAFHCIIAAFQLLHKQGEILNIDLNDFNHSMYAQMIRLALNPNVGKISRNVLLKSDDMVYRSKSEMELVLIGFEFLFIKRKQLSFERIAAFIKRLSTISTNMPVNSLLASLCMMKSLFIKYPRLNQLMDSEGRVGTGVYMGELDDPDLCNPFATSLWEFGLLKNHYHPSVREYSEYVGAIGRNGSSSVHSQSKFANYKLDYNYFLEQFGVHKFNPQEAFVRPVKSIPKRKCYQGYMYGFNGGRSQFLKDLQKKIDIQDN